MQEEGSASCQMLCSDPRHSIIMCSPIPRMIHCTGLLDKKIIPKHLSNPLCLLSISPVLFG